MIAHRGLRFWTPISDAHAERLLGLLGAHAGECVLDVGCGRAEMLLRLLEAGAGPGVGIEANPRALAIARTEAEARVLPTSVEFLELDAQHYHPEPRRFDIALCVAATHALGGLEPALRTLKAWVRPGGRVLLGEGYWKRPPAPEYLAWIDSQADEMRDREGNRAAVEAAGFEVIENDVAGDDEWAHYEGNYLAATEDYARSHPGDPEAAAMLAHVRRWNEGYRRWGHDTMGLEYFALRSVDEPLNSPSA